MVMVSFFVGDVGEAGSSPFTMFSLASPAPAEKSISLTLKYKKITEAFQFQTSSLLKWIKAIIHLGHYVAQVTTKQILYYFYLDMKKVIL